MPNRSYSQFIDFHKKIGKHDPTSWIATDDVAGSVTARNILDVSSPGTYSASGIYYQQQGVFDTNNAIVLDGYQGSLALDNDTITSMATKFTLTFCYRTVGIRNNKINILNITDGSNNIKIVKELGAGVGLSIQTNSESVTGQYINSLNNDSWNMVVLVSDEINLKLYINGELYVSTVGAAIGTTPTKIVFGGVVVGGVVTEFSRFGLSDIISFNDEVKSSDEVRVMYYDDVDNSSESDGTGDKNFVFTQSIPSVEWNVNHSLAKLSSVTIMGSDSYVVDCDVKFIDNNNVKLIFSEPFAGKATFN